MSKIQLYTPLQTWQTRILRLHPAEHPDAVLEADLLRAGLADGSHLSLSMDEPLIQFNAISYTWGKDTRVYDDIICNGLRTAILPSLGTALRRFRLPNEPRFLWADALCINQSDDAEKNIQVANMFTIFNKAKSVLVWLGEEIPSLGATMEHLEINGVFDKYYDFNDADNIELPSEFQHALMNLCLKPWNRRAWVQQEVYAARDIEVSCGPLTFDFDRYLSALLFTRKTPWFLNSEPLELVEKLYYLVDNLRSATNTEILEAHENKAIFQLEKHRHKRYRATRDLGNFSRSTFEGVVLRCRYLDASDQRDYVYALLNLTPCPILPPQARYEIGQLGLPVDYSLSVSEVLQDVTRFIMNNDESIIVLEVYDARGNTPPSVPGLPSWVVDWRTQTYAGTEGVGYVRYKGKRQWKWQLPNPEGTIAIGGTLLAAIESVDSDMKPDSEELWPYTIAIESYSYISSRLLPPMEQSNAAAKTNPDPSPQVELFWVEQGYRTSYFRYMENDVKVHPASGRSAQRYWEYHVLRHVRPGDWLVHVDGMVRSLAYLRPCAKTGRFTFICIVNLGAHLELVVGGRPPPRLDSSEWLQGNLFQSSAKGSLPPDGGYPVDDAFDRLLEQETRLHREFVVC